ncbi:MAG: hypothetical protein H6Q14_2689 [Bacteroidetes bacterium]|nr:hypothetical protein [Bacteroidota bacterium]
MRLLPFKIRLFLLTFLYGINASAIDFVTELTVRDLSLGSITIGTGSPLSLAGQGDSPNQLLVGYRNKFSMKELAVASFAGLYRSSFMTNAVSISSAGYEDYRQTMVGLHAQKTLSPQISFGVALQAVSVSAITLEKGLWEVYPRLGLEYKPDKALLLGLNVHNPIRFGSAEHERLATHFRVTSGASYRISEQLLVASEYEWVDSGKNRFRFGTEFALLPELKVRAGLESHPFSPSFGFGYTYKQWVVDVTSEHHRYLGSSLSIGLSYLFQK